MARLSLKKMTFSELVVLRDRVQGELSRKIGLERGALEKKIHDLAKLERGATTMASKTAARRRPVSPVAPPPGSPR